MATPTQSEFEKMSKQQLKSWLTAQRVDLPGEDRPKSFFLTLALSKSQTRPHRPRRSRKRSRSAVEAGDDDGNPRPQPSRRAAKRTRTIPTVSSQVPEENTSKSPVPRRRLKRRRSSSRSKKKSRSRSRSKSKKARTSKHTRTTIRVDSPVKLTTSASYRSPQFNKLCESSPENDAMAVDRTSEDDTDEDVEMTAEPQKSISREQNIPLECSTETNNVTLTQAQPASPELPSSAPSLNYSSTRHHSTTTNPSRVVSSPRMTLSNRRQTLDASPRRKTSSQPIIPPPMRSPVQLSSTHTPALGALIQPAPLFTGGSSSHGILSPGSAFAGNLIPIDLSSSLVGRPNLRMPAQFGVMGRVSPRISRQKRWHEFIVICLRIALVGMCGMLALYGLFISLQDFLFKIDPIYCDSSHKLTTRSYTEQDCIPCPKNAICAGGNVFCKGDRSWDKKRQLCDFGNVEALVSQISIASEKFCGARYGEFLCGISESRLVTQTELQEHIASVLGMHRTSELFNYVFKKYYQTISEDRGRTQPISYHLGSDSFESRVAIRPFWCQTRHILWKYKFWVFVVCPMFVGSCFWLFRWYTFNIVLPSQAAYLERDVVKILRTRASEHHQPEFLSIKRVRSALGSRAKDDRLWLRTKKLIDQNQKIQVSLRTFEGENCMCWKFLPV